MNKSPKALYIHIPFCDNICDYCDFTKLQYFRFLAEDYLIKLKEELNSYRIRNLQTIYIGGGTPTALEDDLFYQLLQIVSQYTKGVKEYTIEANPESLTENKLKMMKDFGVNRLSIGVESTNDQILKAINRKHTFADVQKAINLAKQMGFFNINVDLILGLPNAYKSQLKNDLDNLLSLPISHISCYSLSIHPNTVFYLKGIKEQDNDTERELYDYVHEILKKSGFHHYEISNWAKPGKESLHNMTYWKDQRYYGVGLGASGYIDNYRYINTKSINEYLKGVTIKSREEVTLKDDKEYFIMLNLRTTRGILLREYYQRFHEDFYISKQEKIDNFIQQELLIYDLQKGSIFPTYKGMMILDTILRDLFY